MKRRAFTLLEVLLVLAILVVAGAIATPHIRSSLESSRLRSAGQQLKADFAKAHVRAMREGATILFRHEVDGSRYQFGPMIDGSAELQVATPETIDPNNAGNLLATVSSSKNGAEPSNPKEIVTEKQLPEGLTFGISEGYSSNRVARLQVRSQAPNSNEDAGWSEPIPFFADGTATDFTVTIKNELDQSVDVKVLATNATVQVTDGSNETTSEGIANQARPR